MAEPENEKQTSTSKNSDRDNDNQISLPKEFQTIIELIPQEKREEAERSLVGFFYRKSERFVGPMPPPHYLKQYNEIIPGGAERILAMAENQSNHRMRLEDFSIREEHRQSSKGQDYGLIVAVFIVAVAGALAYLGHEVVAGILGGGTIVGLVSVFVLGKRQQQDSLDDKD